MKIIIETLRKPLSEKILRLAFSVIGSFVFVIVVFLAWYFVRLKYNQTNNYFAAQSQYLDQYVKPIPTTTTTVTPNPPIPKNGVNKADFYNFFPTKEKKAEYLPVLETVGGKTMFKDTYYGYEMDFTDVKGASIDTTQYMYPFPVYHVQTNVKTDGSSDSSFLISAPIENPAQLSMEEFAKQFANYGDKGKGDIGDGYTQVVWNYGPITQLLMTDKVKIVDWMGYSKNSAVDKNIVGAKFYLVEINGRMIHLRLYDKGGKYFSGFDKAVSSFVVTKSWPPITEDVFLLDGTLKNSAKLEINPNYGRIGDEITLSGSLWQPNADLYFYGAGTIYSVSRDPFANVRTDNQGNFTYKFRVPAQFVEEGGNVLRIEAYSKPSRGTGIFYLFRY